MPDVPRISFRPLWLLSLLPTGLNESNLVTDEPMFLKRSRLDGSWKDWQSILLYNADLIPPREMGYERSREPTLRQEMASNKNTNITFFDIPTALPDKRSTSPFTWKVRFVLNYKKLNYTTVWVKSPHVRQTCIDNGFKPTGKLPDGSLHYTLPVIIDKTDAANPVVIADSNDIIQYLETRYPPSDLSLSLLPYTAGTGAGVAPALHMIFERYTSSNFQIFIPLVMEFNVKKLPADSIAFYEKTIKERFGKELSQLSPGPIGSKEREEAWSKAEEAFAGLGDCLDKNSGGIWLMGERPTLADIHLLGMLMSLKVGSEEAWERVSKWDGGRWGRYMDAAKEFSAVN